MEGLNETGAAFEQAAGKETVAGVTRFAMILDPTQVEYGLQFVGKVREFGRANLQADPMIAMEAPTFVESVVTAEGNTLRVHFIARIEPSAASLITRRPAILSTMMEDDPHFRVRIHSRDQPSRVTTINAKTNMRVSGREITALIKNAYKVLMLQFE